MFALGKAVGFGVAALVIACGGGASAEPGARKSAGGSQSAPAASSLSAEGGSAEIPALTEDELGRLLDALEQEIGKP